MFAPLTHWFLLSVGWNHRGQQTSNINTLTYTPANNVFNVAIIGAGIGGASAAYELRQLSSLSPKGRMLNITVFEAESRVGGRIKSVLTYDGANSPVYAEAGAPFFQDDDECMFEAINRVGLHTALDSKHDRRGRDVDVGVWDGRVLVRRRASDFTPSPAEGWTEQLRLLLRYGRSFRRVQCLAEAWRSRIREFYVRLYWSGGDVNEAAGRKGSVGSERQTAKRLLKAHNVSSIYADHIVEARTRGTLARDVAALNDMSLIRAIRPSRSRFVAQLGFSNQSIVERLLMLAGVNLRLGTKIIKIAHGTDARYTLVMAASSALKRSSSEEYDAVVIAAPLRSVGLELFGNMPPGKMPVYEERHVTHFTNAQALDGGYFNILPSARVPHVVYTIKDNVDVPFYSIETNRVSLGIRGCIAESEYLYRIVSAAAIPDKMILELLGKREDLTLSEAGVNWVHRQVWPDAFPIVSNNTPHHHMELAPRIQYASVGEHYESSLENSCRFGIWAGQRVWRPKIDVEP